MQKSILIVWALLYVNTCFESHSIALSLEEFHGETVKDCSFIKMVISATFFIPSRPVFWFILPERSYVNTRWMVIICLFCYKLYECSYSELYRSLLRLAFLLCES